VDSAISLATHLPPEALLPNTHFLNLGIDSLKGIEFINTIQEQLGLRLSYDVLFEFPTVDRLAEILISRYRVPLLAMILKDCDKHERDGS
jgi:bacillaene polyketide synthase PksL/BaeL